MQRKIICQHVLPTIIGTQYFYIRKTVEMNSATQGGTIFAFIRSLSSFARSTTLGSSEGLLSGVMFRDNELPGDLDLRKDR